jgi:hypothetical protein
MTPLVPAATPLLPIDAAPPADGDRVTAALAPVGFASVLQRTVAAEPDVVTTSTDAAPAPPVDTAPPRPDLALRRVPARALPTPTDDRTDEAATDGPEAAETLGDVEAALASSHRPVLVVPPPAADTAEGPEAPTGRDPHAHGAPVAGGAPVADGAPIPARGTELDVEQPTPPRTTRPAPTGTDEPTPVASADAPQADVGEPRFVEPAPFALPAPAAPVWMADLAPAVAAATIPTTTVTATPTPTTSTTATATVAATVGIGGHAPAPVDGAPVGPAVPAERPPVTGGSEPLVREEPNGLAPTRSPGSPTEPMASPGVGGDRAEPTPAAARANPAPAVPTPAVTLPEVPLPAVPPALAVDGGAPPAAPAAPGAPWSLVHRAIASLEHGPTGTQRLRVSLQPDELGEVLVEITVDQGRLDIRLLTETPTARDRLLAETGRLEAALAESGLRTGALDIDARGHGDRDRTPPTPPRAQDTVSVPVSVPAPGPYRAAVPAGRIDLVL